MDFRYRLLLFCVLVFANFSLSFAQRPWIMSTDELENHINPEDLQDFFNMRKQNESNVQDVDYASMDSDHTTRRPDYVDCFGLGSVGKTLQTWFLNMKPDSSDVVNTHFFFSSRLNPVRVQVFPGEQFGLEWVDFKAKRKTIMIVHGFMSHSNASWVNDMTKSFLQWGDVNVIAVDWSGGGNTWKYWRAVANTRRVGADVTKFFRQLIAATGARIKDFHFVGHSLGAHISSFVSYQLGGVARITGLDPAQPCFSTSNHTERLDSSDADFVDVIHTNGRLLKKIGFGLPDPMGHADFYPNGGMKQPGCFNQSSSLWSKLRPDVKLQQAVCSHGRAYLLFTESLINNDCTFRAHRWNLTYEGVNASLEAACDRTASCAEMGITAIGGKGSLRAKGPYFVLTAEKQPYCPSEYERRHPRPDLLKDLREGFRLDRSQKPNYTSTKLPAYADPLSSKNISFNDESNEITTRRSWWPWG